MLISEPKLTENNGKTFTATDGETYAFPINKELQTGVYRTGLNPGLRRMGYEDYPVLGNVSTFKVGDAERSFGDFNSYGVCDDFQQILDQCPEIVNSTGREFVITLAEMCKEDQPDWGGWRWHKWGPYIGTQEPTTEYLYDEPIIERVFCYHIYEKKK